MTRQTALMGNPDFWRGMARNREALMREAEQRGERVEVERHARTLKEYEAQAARLSATFRPAVAA
jgi:hypothetical protein